MKQTNIERYEATPVGMPLTEEDENSELFSPFGPMILKSKAPKALVQRMNSFADANPKTQASCEFLLTNEQCLEGGDESLIRYTGNLIRSYIHHVDRLNITSVDFEAFWIVNQLEKTSSPTHFHSCPIAGILYLQTPTIEDGVESGSYMLGREAGYINFLHGGKQPFSKSLVSFQPVVGDIYIFPGWLLHVAEPFVGTGTRRSLAFNAQPQSQTQLE